MEATPSRRRLPGLVVGIACLFATLFGSVGMVWHFSAVSAALACTIDGPESTLEHHKDMEPVRLVGPAARVTIKALKEQYALLEPVEILIRVENMGTDVLRVRAAPAFGDYRYELVDQNGQVVPRTRYGLIAKSSAHNELLPDKIHEERKVLDRGFQITFSGTYKLRVAALVLTDNGGRTYEPVWSNEIDLQILNVRSETKLRDGQSKRITRSGEVQHGYQVTVLLSRDEYEVLEPVTIEASVSNVSALPLVSQATEGSTHVHYVCELLSSPGHREVPLTQFGKAREFCKHRPDQPLSVGQSHVDQIILTKYFDLSLTGEYELHVTAELPGDADSPSPVRLTAPPLKFKIVEKK